MFCFETQCFNWPSTRIHGSTKPHLCAFRKGWPKPVICVHEWIWYWKNAFLNLKNYCGIYIHIEDSCVHSNLAINMKINKMKQSWDELVESQKFVDAHVRFRWYLGSTTKTHHSLRRQLRHLHLPSWDCTER